MQQEKIAYRVREAAEALGFSVGHTRLLIRTGKLASRRSGRAVLVPATALRDFISPPITREQDPKAADAYIAVCESMWMPDASFDVRVMRLKLPHISDDDFNRGLRQAINDGQVEVTHIKWSKPTRRDHV